jgi:type I restriction enzyme R subunit
MTNLNFSKGQFDETQLEEAIISLFTANGYEHTHGEHIHRKLDEVLLEDDLRNYLSTHYKTENLTEIETEKIINHIKMIQYDQLFIGNRETFWLINEGFALARDDTSKNAIHINYINYDEPAKNTFRIVNQFPVAVSGTNTAQTRRPDMLLFINGIPIAIFEFKSAIREDATIADAWKQINIRYTRDIPRLLKYCFLSVITDGANTKLGTAFTPYKFYYAWNKATETEKTSNGISALLTTIKGAFSKERIIEILRDFIYYSDTKEEVIVCRYPQYFAAKKMLDSIKKHMKPHGNGKGGTYFGATGCGKTHAMLYLSRLIKLRDKEKFNNPTIIILEDREDLNIQTSELFEASKRFLHDNNVRSIESRQDLKDTLGKNASGGVYITTIQKFYESTELLDDRHNIICISDEAHRTQTNVGTKIKTTNKGIFTARGFAQYLRDSLPNATYCGFTGTPIDETISVFGEVVDMYTMKQSTDDGITVRIAYEPRLARVILSDEQANEIKKYYAKCIAEGANPEQVEESERNMSEMARVLEHPDRLKQLAKDIVMHYEMLCAEKPKIVQKAMIVCASRQLAYKVFKEILNIRSDWDTVMKLVATSSANDEKELYELCGTKEYRKELAKLFKNPLSNFKIAIVVDMWITGFDISELAVMYIDKPIQKHALIQTLSRVNRNSDGKERGLIVDYIGIREDMLAAINKYGKDQGNPVDELNIALGVFRNNLQLLIELLHSFNPEKFFKGEPQERLICLNAAAEFAQIKKDTETRFMQLSREMKAAFEICSPSGELTDNEVKQAQFFLAIRSILYKQTIGDAPDAEIMNNVVEKMVQEAITCTGIENIVNAGEAEDIFSDKIQAEALGAKLPITKFNALLKLLRKAISSYGKKNKVKAIEFDERLKKVVERYNNRDKLAFTSEVVADFINDLSGEIIKIYNDLKTDKASFSKLGITFEEKAFYDILVKVRNEHIFPYEDRKCIALAKKIKELVDDKSAYADWATRDDIKNQLNEQLTVLLYKNGYPPEWDEEVFEKVMEQAQNFKRWEKYPTADP